MVMHENICVVVRLPLNMVKERAKFTFLFSVGSSALKNSDKYR